AGRRRARPGRVPEIWLLHLPRLRSARRAGKETCAQSVAVCGVLEFRAHQPGRDAYLHAKGPARSRLGRHPRLLAFEAGLAQSEHDSVTAGNRPVNRAPFAISVRSWEPAELDPRHILGREGLISFALRIVRGVAHEMSVGYCLQ